MVEFAFLSATYVSRKGADLLRLARPSVVSVGARGALGGSGLWYLSQDPQRAQEMARLQELVVANLSEEQLSALIDLIITLPDHLNLLTDVMS